MVGTLLMVFGGSVLGGLGLFQWESARHSSQAIDAAPRRLWKLSRQMWSLLTGSILGLGLLSLIPAFGLQGSTRLFVGLLALSVWWTIALIVPRIPLLKAEKQRKAVRLALPAAVNQWRIGLEAGEKLIPLMERYILIPRPERAALQAVIINARAAIDAGKTHIVHNSQTGEAVVERMLFSDALLAEAHKLGCPELTTVMTILANADREGGIRTAVPALKRASATLETIIHHEIDELLTKRSLKLIVASSPAVVGAVLLLIYVAAAGNTIPF